MTDSNDLHEIAFDPIHNSVVPINSLPQAWLIVFRHYLPASGNLEISDTIRRILSPVVSELLDRLMGNLEAPRDEIIDYESEDEG